jgi:hypothetical protein
VSNNALGEITINHEKLLGGNYGYSSNKIDSKIQFAKKMIVD